MTTEALIKICRRTALISFTAGTIIFALHYFTMGSYFIITGYFFILVMGIINLILLGFLLSKVLREKTNREKLLLNGLLMLLNIPVMLLYCWITIVIMNTVRITLVNAANITATDIRFTGCEEKRIESLAPGKSTTVWINIPNDCSVRVDYMSGQQARSAFPVGYVTNSMGHQITWQLGAVKQPGNAVY